jgi:transposase
MDRQTLRDWAHRYSEGGVDALKSRRNPGRTPYLTEAQLGELRQLVVDEPDLATDKVVRWRIVDLQGTVKRRSLIKDHFPSPNDAAQHEPRRRLRYASPRWNS